MATTLFERWLTERLDEARRQASDEWYRSYMADGCPSCPGDVVPPSEWRDLGDGYFRATYKCPRCGWSWWTSWEMGWVHEGAPA